MASIVDGCDDDNNVANYFHLIRAIRTPNLLNLHRSLSRWQLILIEFPLCRSKCYPLKMPLTSFDCNVHTNERNLFRKWEFNNQMIGNNERNRQSLIFSSEHQISTWFRFFTLHFSHAAKISFRIFSPKENTNTLDWVSFPKISDRESSKYNPKHFLSFQAENLREDDDVHLTTVWITNWTHLECNAKYETNKNPRTILISTNYLKNCDANKRGSNNTGTFTHIQMRITCNRFDVIRSTESDSKTFRIKLYRAHDVKKVVVLRGEILFFHWDIFHLCVFLLVCTHAYLCVRAFIYVCVCVAFLLDSI